jgi:hypothetical protein
MTNRSPDESRYRRLRLYNAAMGVLHAVQGIVILILANDFSLPVSATFMADAPGAQPPELTHLFDLRVAWGIAAFVFISALAHFIIAAPGGFDAYKHQLMRQQNAFRWVEYAFSASIMIVLIAMITGITDIAALVALFGVNASMILFGWLMEKYEQPGNPNWLPFFFGCVAGIVPWIAIGIYFFSPGEAADPPNFVYGIFFSLFVFFNVFALNQWLQYRRIGPWRDYLFGEAVYVLLSLTAKSALAWQVFFPTLA